MTKKKTKTTPKKAPASPKGTGPKAAKMKVVRDGPAPGKPEKLNFKIEMDGETTKITALGDMEQMSRNLAGLIVRYPKLMTLLEDATCLVRHQNFIEKEYLKTKKP